MDAQLDDVVRRGEPLAVLTASEGPIYGRFGYGLATFNARWTMPTDGLAFATPSRAGGRVRLLTAGGPSIAQSVFDGAEARRVGEVTRSAGYWERVFAPRRGPASPAGEGKPFFTVVHETDDGTADAFARYAVKEDYAFGRPAGRARRLEPKPPTPKRRSGNTSRAWTSARCAVGDRPLDDRCDCDSPPPPPGHRVTDHLWVRGRRRSACRHGRTRTTVVLELVDAFRPGNGRWRRGSPAGGSARTDAHPTRALGPGPRRALPRWRDRDDPREGGTRP
jgi:hypothetical protein